MPREPRRLLPDGHFHMMCRAIEGGSLFRRDADRKLYLGLLQLAVERYRWRVLTLSLMDNHVHLLVGATTDRLSKGMWFMNWRYAEYFKREYGPRFGHVFGNRPKTKAIRGERYLLAVIRYIALNPVGVFVERPEQHRWTAHRALIGESPVLPILARDECLDRFGPGDRVARYAAFIAGTDPDDHEVVRRWSSLPPAGDAPPLEALVSDRTATAYLAAHVAWGHSIRAIAAAASVSKSEVHRLIAEARDKGTVPLSQGVPR